jgi:hypothetical protein
MFCVVVELGLSQGGKNRRKVCLKQGAEETLETKNEKNNRWPEKIA